MNDQISDPNQPRESQDEKPELEPEQPEQEQQEEPEEVEKTEEEAPQNLIEPKMEKITAIQVSYPSEVETVFGSTMVYKVAVERDGKKTEVFKRYSEFWELRNALINKFPCLFIMPVHKRQFLGNKNRNFLMHRMFELNTFCKYLLQRDFLIQSEVVQVFFSSREPKEIMKIVKSVKRPSPESLFETYGLIFGDLKKEENAESPDIKHSKIEKFKLKIETNIEFFYRLKNCIESYNSKRQELKLQDEENQIYEMILITYSNQTQRYEELKKLFGLMTTYDHSTQWSLFAHKIEMLIRELEFFYEMVNQIRAYENQYVANEDKRKKYKEKLASLSESEEETVGFFKRQNRRDVIKKYQDLLFDADQKSVFWRDLLNLIYNIVIKSELRIFKRRKKTRYSEILRDFGLKKMDNMQHYVEFWNNIIDNEPRNK